MKHRLSIVALAIVLLTSACVKDGDFDELKHPLLVQGEFDPTYGFPIAWADADLGTLLGFIPSGVKFQVLTDPVSGLLTLEKDSILHKCYTTYNGTKGGKSWGSKDGKSVVFRNRIEHGNKIGLEDLKKHDIVLKRLDIRLTAFVQAFVSGSTQELENSDAEIYFDTIRMTVDFEDGSTFNANLFWDESVNVQEMLEGKTITLVDYDASWAVDREAKRVRFSTAINVAANGSDHSPNYMRDQLHVDSLVIDCHVLVDFPAIMYVGNLNEIDTLEADMSMLDSIMKDPQVSTDTFTISLNDTATNYLYIDADNGLPANLTVQLKGLDSNHVDVTGDLLPDQSFFVASPVTEVPEVYSTGLYEGYMADGRTHTEIKVRITTEMLRNLAKAKYLVLTLHATTPTELPAVGDEAKPFVIIRDEDRMKLKVSLQVSPHITVNIPMNPIMK